jgi:hypothetical protein
MGVSAKPMNDAFGKALRRLLREAIGHHLGLFIHLATKLILAGTHYCGFLLLS